MDILMLRFDIFEQLHEELYKFWRDIIPSYIHNNVKEFIRSFLLGHDISDKMLPKVYMLLKSHPLLRNTLNELRGEQADILDYLGFPRSLTIAEEIDEHFAHVVSEEGMDKIREYYEIEESKKIILHDINNLEYIIYKEMKKFWNRIDTLIINSYKQMLYDVTGSDDLVRSFVNEARIVGLTRSLYIAKREHDYETISNALTALDGSIASWISEIEQLLGVDTT